MTRRTRETPKKKAMTSAERQAKWRLSHCKVNDVLSPPTLLLACHPNGKIDLDELEGSAAKTMELYNKLVAIITGWLDKLDASTLSTADGFTAFKLLAPTLDSLVTLLAKIAEQRVTEARCDPAKGSAAQDWGNRHGFAAQPVRRQDQAEGEVITSRSRSWRNSNDSHCRRFGGLSRVVTVRPSW
jgi:hypothetical protein